MVDFAPLNYERYTVIVSPLMIPMADSVMPNSRPQGTEAVTPKRTNFDLPKGQPFTDKTEKARASFGNKAQPEIQHPAPLTFSGPPSQLNTSSYLNLLRESGRSYSPVYVAGLYEAQSAPANRTINLQG
ncbi:MAG: hypothetical protein COB46_13435 [Rhodospirillaceae bacterium]|nr:MAG: hypothetical protein COB46_13435 [Rhodospirillaceae bacterium]